MDLLNFLSFRNKTLIHRIAVVLTMYLGLSLSAFKTIAFESSILPVTPQTVIRFSSMPISEWQVAALTLDKISTEYTDSLDTLLNIPRHFNFYRNFSRAPRDHSADFINDLRALAGILVDKSTSKDKIGLCGDLKSVFETKMKIHFTIARNIGDCEMTNKLWIARNKSVEELLEDLLCVFLVCSSDFVYGSPLRVFANVYEPVLTIRHRSVKVSGYHVPWCLWHC